MGASGTATLDFGAFPGASITNVDVVATGVISTSAVEAWIRPVATADHTDADHVVTNMRVVGHYLSDDNIRIWGVNNNDVTPPQEDFIVGRTNDSGLVRNPSRQNAPMLVGTYSVNWVWN